MSRGPNEILLEAALPLLDGLAVRDVRIGLGYMAVVLDGGLCGVAATVLEEPPESCTRIAEAGRLTGGPAADLAVMAVSSSPLRAGIGIATINAALNRGGEPDPGIARCLDLDGAEVAMVGLFRPLVPHIERAARALHVLERRPSGPGVLPESEAPRILPRCDVVVITSQTLLNGTLPEILGLVRGVPALMGPTTPMWDGFGDLGVGHLFGRVATDVPALLAAVSEAGGTRRFSASTEKVHLEL